MMAAKDNLEFSSIINFAVSYLMNAAFILIWSALNIL